MSTENLKCGALAVPEIIAIRVLVGSCDPSLGEEEVVEGGGGHGWSIHQDGTIQNSVGDFL